MVSSAQLRVMQIDWITWSVFAIGLAMLLYWCFQTAKEFRELFQRRYKRIKENNDGSHTE